MRFSRTTLGAGLALAAALSFAAPAGAQDYPPTTPTTAPPTTATTAPAAPCTVTVSAEGNLVPGGAATIIGTCIRLVDGKLVDGTLNSTPIDLPTVKVVGNTAKFPVTLPADFELKAFHTLNITDAATGQLLLNGRFYVNSSGQITSAPSGIPVTGSNSTTPLASAGVVLLAAGAGAVVVARKRRHADAPAA